MAAGRSRCERVYWLSIADGAENQGPSGHLIAVDGLKEGFPDAINSVFPLKPISAVRYPPSNSLKSRRLERLQSRHQRYEAVYPAPTEGVLMAMDGFSESPGR